MIVILKILSDHLKDLVKEGEKNIVVIIIEKLNPPTSLLCQCSMQQGMECLSQATKEMFIGTMSLLEPWLQMITTSTLSLKLSKLLLELTLLPFKVQEPRRVMDWELTMLNWLESELVRT